MCLQHIFAMDRSHACLLDMWNMLTRFHVKKSLLSKKGMYHLEVLNL